jgi:hypothetical protein
MNIFRHKPVVKIIFAKSLKKKKTMFDLAGQKQHSFRSFV